MQTHATKGRLGLFSLGMWLLASLVMADAVQGQGEVSFTRRDFGVGGGPWSVTVGDFNGDSRQDLATANNIAGTVSILLGQGDGTFQPVQNVEVGTNPISITVGDFNGDGRPDLATAIEGTNSVSILLGQGDGTFQAAPDVEVGAFPRLVTVGDFNSDGRQDLATANASASTVSILLGQGDGTFQPAQDFPVGAEPQSVAVGDFNGDGQQDLVTGNINADAVSILLGQGDGTFQPAQDFAVGPSTRAVAVGDFNGDGQQDLAVSKGSGGTGVSAVSILLGQGDGTFQPAQDFAVGSLPLSVTVGDFNGDGQQDLATANLLSFSVSILLGQGDGTFQPAQDFAVGGAAFSVAVGDFNTDSRQDLATGHAEANTVSILLNNTSVGVEVKLAIKQGRAERLGTTNAKVTLEGRLTGTPLADVDLGASTLTITSILNEAGVELVAGANLPLTLAARSGSDADGATFETPGGARPKVRVDLSHRGGEVVSFRLVVEFASSEKPALCEGTPRTTELTTSFQLEPAPVIVTTTQPWQCLAGDSQLRVPVP
jgi:hypothetical protein